MMRSLVEKYRLGMITDEHLVVESLHRIDPENPALVLGNLPDNILDGIRRFANDYTQGRMVTNYGVLPTQDQVHAAQQWVEESLQHTVDRTK